jgi:hypothetical protein
LKRAETVIPDGTVAGNASENSLVVAGTAAEVLADTIEFETEGGSANALDSRSAMPNN